MFALCWALIRLLFAIYVLLLFVFQCVWFALFAFEMYVLEVFAVFILRFFAFAFYVVDMCAFEGCALDFNRMFSLLPFSFRVIAPHNVFVRL